MRTHPRHKEKEYFILTKYEHVFPQCLKEKIREGWRLEGSVQPSFRGRELYHTATLYKIITKDPYDFASNGTIV